MKKETTAGLWMLKSRHLLVSSQIPYVPTVAKMSKVLKKVHIRKNAKKAKKLKEKTVTLYKIIRPSR